ncbi:unnamed protein product [Trichogramma brassicae]|uniref:Uncharacterized protein n=1 Tax=Trichogramma brassicae TaxID=86971 RepID=A0A6H5IH09_9HYME|nr:unnamed protein product [Trichogramma brassicae]
MDLSALYSLRSYSGALLHSILTMLFIKCNRIGQLIKGFESIRGLHFNYCFIDYNYNNEAFCMLRAFTGEHPAAMQHGNSSNSGAATRTLALLLIILHAGSFTSSRSIYCCSIDEKVRKPDGLDKADIGNTSRVAMLFLRSAHNLMRRLSLRR